MCLIICSPTGKRPDESIIDDAYAINSDGAGIAWSVGEKIKWKKGLDLQGIKAALAEVPENVPFILHFRIASIGPKTPGLTHPFPINNGDNSLELEGECDSLLFQNGTYSQWEDKLLGAVIAKGLEIPPPPWSDSRALALVCHAYGPNILYLLGNNSRFAVFTAASGEKNCRIKVVGDWNESDGLHYSNRSCSVFSTTQRNFTPAATVHTPVVPTTTVPRMSSGMNVSGPVGGVTSTRTRTKVVSGEFPVWDKFDTSGREIRHRASREVPA